MPSRDGHWLRSQGLGVILGQATVILLAVGSVVLAATRDGASAGVGLDDVRAFFEPPSWAHLWFYLLVPVMGLYALNTLLATWHEVTTKWRAGLRTVRTFAPAVFHVAFLVALLAHLVGGVFGEERGMQVVGPAWADLGDGREARLTGLEIPTWPDGRPRQARATVELREAGTTHTEVLSYNGPLSSGLGTDLWLLTRYGEVPRGVRLAAGDARCEVPLHGACTLAGRDLALAEVRTSRFGPPSALVRVLPGEDRLLAPGRPLRLEGGPTIRLEEVLTGPAVLLRRRHAPGNPWALGSALLLGLGLVMMGRRWL